jgi:hypothetical protein
MQIYGINSVGWWLIQPMRFLAARFARSAEQAGQSLLSGKKQRETARRRWWRKLSSGSPLSIALSLCLILACALSIQHQPTPAACATYIAFIVSRIIRHASHDCPPAPQ